MPTAIEFNNVSKQYRLGLVSTRTLSHDLDRWWKVNVMHKEDPYLKIGSVNDRSKAADSEYVWALKDINFKVEQGDVVGIIGKNGAGKSTLLKLLSKVTGPTTGTIKARGRIGSLLEVGTGFHPEMTGRENIYMNGAILGMSKQEVTRKLDEIVNFSGCERYIDTPTKRYSSGMTVRLGFAIAAHLDPEILVVDEVLAVGDAEFQKKAIGKMQDVSQGEGRTVLFVSHNMTSIAKLCNHCVLLSNGMVDEIGETQHIVSKYLMNNHEDFDSIGMDFEIDGKYRVQNFAFNQNGHNNEEIKQGEPFSVCFDLINESDTGADVVFNFEVATEEGVAVTCFGNEFQKHEMSLAANSTKRVSLRFNQMLLKSGLYYVSVYFLIKNRMGIVSKKYVEFAYKLDVEGPSSLYLANRKSLWQSFPSCPQHGHIAIQIDEFVEENK